mmetsp:Transcript_5973/g.18370  ORF Transcript_5973/g.18370 Transcript_5973/m.18370 type:complete len:101 (-) Transcript_5973:194-496(-)
MREEAAFLAGAPPQEPQQRSPPCTRLLACHSQRAKECLVGRHGHHKEDRLVARISQEVIDEMAVNIAMVSCQKRKKTILSTKHTRVKTPWRVLRLLNICS